MTQVVAKKNNGNTEFMDNLLMFHFEYTSLKKLTIWYIYQISSGKRWTI